MQAAYSRAMSEFSNKGKGRIKQAVGSLTDDQKLKREGKRDELKGALEGAVKGGKDAAKGAKAALKTAAK